jgi:hypothetical protein
LTDIIEKPADITEKPGEQAPVQAGTLRTDAVRRASARPARPASRLRRRRRDAYDVSGFDPEVGGTRTPIRYDAGARIPLAPNERGWKDVFRAPGNQMLRVMGTFDGAHGRFMYHCHLLEHEDMGMMRPFVVMPAQVLKFDHGGAHGGHGEGHTG